jgi:hypothetical protein
MKQPIDQLFRDKLEQHSLPAPEAAWSRIEKNLPSKSVNFLYWKVAAALVIGLTSIVILVSKNATQNDDRTYASAQDTENHQSNNLQSLKVDTLKKVNERKGIQKSGKENVKSASKKMQKNPLNLNKSQIDIVQQITSEQTLLSSVAMTDQKNHRLDESAKQVQVDTVTLLETSRTIVLTIDEVNQKYLRKTQLADATTEQRTTSSIKKLFEKAEDLKTTTDGFAELREFKNELFAFSPERLKNRNEKQTRNN